MSGGTYQVEYDEHRRRPARIQANEQKEERGVDGTCSKLSDSSVPKKRGLNERDQEQMLTRFD